MAEKKGVGHAYNVDFLNVVFAASSIFLFLSVVWMVWDDYDRQWKNTQREFAQLEFQVTQASLQQAARSVDRNKLAQFQAQQAAAQKNVEANKAKVDELQGKLEEIDARLFRETQDYQFTKATYTTTGTISRPRASRARRVPRERARESRNWNAGSPSST